MKATDVIKLALAGKTPAEIRELSELDAELEAAAEAKKKEAEAEEAQPAQEDPEPEQNDEEKDEETDYKTLYEEAMKTISDIQAANRKEDMSENENTPEQRQKIIDDLVRKYM